VTCRQPIFDGRVSATDFAEMMGGKQALPWERTEDHPLNRMDDIDARTFIENLLKCAPCPLSSPFSLLFWPLLATSATDFASLICGKQGPAMGAGRGQPSEQHRQC